MQHPKHHQQAPDVGLVATGRYRSQTTRPSTHTEDDSSCQMAAGATHCPVAAARCSSRWSTPATPTLPSVSCRCTAAAACSGLDGPRGSDDSGPIS